MPYDVRPTAGDLEEARAVVEVAMDGVERERTFGDPPLRVGLGWSDDERVATDFGGAAATVPAPDRVEVRFTTRVEGWTDAAMAATARGAGRAWLQRELPDETLAFRWQVVLAEAAGCALADRVARDGSAPWSEPERLRARWQTLEASLDDATDAGPIFGDAVVVSEDGTDPAYPAYPLASLGRLLADERELDALATLTHSDLVAALADALGISTEE